MNTDAMREYATLGAEKTDLTARLDAIKARQAALTEEILNDLSQGTPSVTVLDDHGKAWTISVKQLITARVLTTREQAAQALKRAGLGEFVQENFNLNTLSAYVRELTRAGEPLPAEIADDVGAYEFFQVSLVRSQGRDPRVPVEKEVKETVHAG